MVPRAVHKWYKNIDKCHKILASFSGNNKITLFIWKYCKNINLCHRESQGHRVKHTDSIMIDFQKKKNALKIITQISLLLINYNSARTYTHARTHQHTCTTTVHRNIDIAPSTNMVHTHTGMRALNQSSVPCICNKGRHL